MKVEHYDKKGNYILAVCPNPSIDIFAWVNQIAPGKSNRITREQRYPGGKGVHVALALAEMGETVKLLGFWGGPTGSWIKSQCEGKYADLKCIGPSTNGWSRSCYTFKTKGEFDETEVLGKGPELTENDLNSFFEVFNESVGHARCIVLSGSWPHGTAGDEYQQLIDLAYHCRKACLVDFTGHQLTNALNARPYAVHLNHTEFYDNFGNNNPEKSIASLLNRCEMVALTNGAEGLYLVEKNRTIHALATVDQVYSAVGSGDCLMAGLALAFSKNLDSIEAAGLAASCGAANCLREDLGMLFRDDVNLLYKNTETKVSQGHYYFV